MTMCDKTSEAGSNLSQSLCSSMVVVAAIAKCQVVPQLVVQAADYHVYRTTLVTVLVTFTVET